MWFYTGNESSHRDQSKSWFAFLKSKESKTETGTATEPVKEKSGKTLIQNQQSSAIAAKEIPAVAIDSAEEQKADSDFKTDTLPVEENIIVKQDQLLISAALPVEDKSEMKEKDESMTSSAVEKLNPAADLPEEEKHASSFQVEFWVSPINYRGYKMSKNKIILFGIEEPDAVKLYRTNDGIYMTYLKEFYHLYESLEFVSYQKLKESEIPLAIK